VLLPLATARPSQRRRRAGARPVSRRSVGAWLVSRGLVRARPDPRGLVRARAYHRRVSLVTLVLLFVLFVIALIPAMRLWTAGFSVGARAAYLVTLVSFGLLALEVRPLSRFLLPIGLLLYLLPFSGLPERWSRWRGRAERSGAASRTSDRPAGASGQAHSGPRFERFSRGPIRDDTVIEGRAVRLDDEAKAPREES
jgi:hypothetical protein